MGRLSSETIFSLQESREVTGGFLGGQQGPTELTHLGGNVAIPKREGGHHVSVGGLGGGPANARGARGFDPTFLKWACVFSCIVNAPLVLHIFVQCAHANLATRSSTAPSTVGRCSPIPCHS